MGPSLALPLAHEVSWQPGLFTLQKSYPLDYRCFPAKGKPLMAPPIVRVGGEFR
jgi:hypothetical protein